MTPTETEPIRSDWTTERPDVPAGREPTDPRPTRQWATATDVTRRLACLDVADIDPQLVPHLAAAAAELALLTGIPWQFSADDPPVALLRLLAKVASTNPHAAGPHTTRLLDRLP